MLSSSWKFSYKISANLSINVQLLQRVSWHQLWWKKLTESRNRTSPCRLLNFSNSVLNNKSEYSYFRYKCSEKKFCGVREKNNCNNYISFHTFNKFLNSFSSSAFFLSIIAKELIKVVNEKKLPKYSLQKFCKLFIPFCSSWKFSI